MSSRSLTVLLLTVLTFTLADKTNYILRIPPSIVSQGEEHYIYRTDSIIILPCVASGTPKPEYEWIRNGEPLEMRNNIRMSAVDGTVTIDPATTLDEGFYQCIAFNSYGKTLTGVSHLQRAVLAGTAGNVMTTVYDVREGDSLMVRCQSVRSSPAPVMTWLLTETIVSESAIALTLNRRITIDEKGYLYFAHVTQSDHRDNYLYKCNIFNPYLDQTTGGSYSTINVQADGAGGDSRPTKLHSSPSTVVALIGQEEARLKCFFAGKPTPRIDWERAGQQLPVGRYAREQYDSELVILNVQEEDEGDYKCWSRNSLGKSEEVTIHLDVQSKPIFRPGWQPVDTNATEGEEFSFNCQAPAEPEAEITWMVNGEPVNYDDLGPGRTVSADRHTYTVSNLCKDCPAGRNDLMVVQCNASNVHGYVFASGYLNVLVKTQIFTAPTSQLITIGETERIEFKCEASTDDSTPLTITWEKDDVRIYPSMDDRMTIHDNNSLFINVKNLTMEKVTQGYAGQYQCVASNTYSEAIVLVTLNVVGAPNPDPVVAKGLGDYWWIFMIIVLLFLIFILCLCCCICCQRNKGDTYPVDEKERANGNDPERELERDGFQDYQRPEDTEPVKGSRASLTSTIKLDSDDDGSLNEYGDIDAMKFNEDGSFIAEPLIQRNGPSYY